MASKSSNCLKYKICHSENLGRYLVSAKNISAGEVIIREDPVVVGPATFNKSSLCFSCLRHLSAASKKSHYICSKCNVAPLCNSFCEDSLGHHTKEECQLLESDKEFYSKNIQQITEILMHFRMWLLKVKNSNQWEQINEMEDHSIKRRNTEIWQEREESVVDVFREMKLISANDKNAGELVQKICGILDVNSFELRSPGGMGESPLRGLYLKTSLIAHECRGNTHITVDDKFQLTVFASLPIQKGEIIYFNYTSSLLGSAERKEHLREGKYFECKCSTCLDPFEGGSHLSSIICPRCRKGFVTIKNPLTINHYDKGTNWECQSCKRNYFGCLIKSTLEISKSLINNIEIDDIKKMENLLKTLSSTFHTNHFLILNLKQKLLTEYRRELSSPNPQKKTLLKMFQLCKEVYNVLEIIEPGISRAKGILLYEMHFPVAILANRAYAANEISSHDLLLKLQEAEDLLKKSLKMLLLEPATTPEGILTKRALQELKILSQNIDDVKSLSLTQSPKNRNLKKRNNFRKH
ncbi:SET domain-containing protein SmydA-8-like [Leptopilina boulardi]|uniref:SET domain-containing protein SmydA-8-like n=1 Tax=Leptopilina boulardi TaxID=63433 RepID=UPI0021F5121B|nr:SET domain-containing protein SmydA-8-like [Leptopilina boulardi]